MDHFCLGRKPIKFKPCADSSCRQFDIFVYVKSTCVIFIILGSFPRTNNGTFFHGPPVRMFYSIGAAMAATKPANKGALNDIIFFLANAYTRIKQTALNGRMIYGGSIASSAPVLNLFYCCCFFTTFIVFCLFPDI